MEFCSKCGTQLGASAAFCGDCGTRVTAPSAGQQSASTAFTPPTEKVSMSWKEKFALIEKAGGPKFPKARELAFGEQSKVVFNVWGFLFGPFYYLVKGMWKKAIVLTALCIIAIAIFEVMLERMGVSAAITNFIAPAVFATRANIDYYKKVLLGDNGWW